MHTARLLTVSPSMHCAGGSAPGEGGLVPGGLLLGGGVPGAGGSAQEGAWSRGGGCLVLWRCLVLGAWCQGGLLPGGGWLGGIPACTEADIPSVDRILDTRY